MLLRRPCGTNSFRSPSVTCCCFGDTDKKTNVFALEVVDHSIRIPSVFFLAFFGSLDVPCCDLARFCCFLARTLAGKRACVSSKISCGKMSFIAGFLCIERRQRMSETMSTQSLSMLCSSCFLSEPLPTAGNFKVILSSVCCLSTHCRRISPLIGLCGHFPLAAFVLVNLSWLQYVEPKLFGLANCESAE